MSNLFACAICGLCRYNHDVVRAPKLTTGGRKEDWHVAIGENAMKRINKVNAAFICVEHFGDVKSTFDKDGKLRKRAVPTWISAGEQRKNDDYFNDHGYFKLDKVPERQDRMLNVVNCSQCSQMVPRNEMTLHAETHAPVYMNLYEHLCKEHVRNPKPPTELFSSECINCSNIQSRAAYTLAQSEAERCFPMFKFNLIEQREFRHFTYMLMPELRREYLNARPHRCGREKENDPPGKKVKIEEESSDFDLVDIKEESSFDEEPENAETDDDYVPSEESDDEEELEKEWRMENGDKKSYRARDVPCLSLEDEYDEDPHPTLEKLIQICERLGVCQFHTIFNFYEVRRRLERVKCAKGDTCSRIRRFMEMENLPIELIRLDPEQKQKMLEAFALHKETGKNFSTGFSYMLADQLKLAPNFVRYEYKKFRRQGPPTTPAQKRFPVVRRYTAEMTRILEEAFETKHLLAPDREWPRGMLKLIGKKAGITAEQVSNWMGKRKLKSQAQTPPERRHTFTRHEFETLHSEFLKNAYPSTIALKQLAEHLNLAPLTVMRFFDTQRTTVRKQRDLKTLTKDLAEIPEEKCAVLRDFYEKKSNYANERVALAESLGLSYQLVTHWLEQYKKSVSKGRGRSMKMKNSSGEHIDSDCSEEL
ncbi:unnamed protein product [Caenorhabditis sp. 36 PRJEB53466]|nr:unnamed protein product [Caenorhabditis sp. 36 PRJEB53466]